MKIKLIFHKIILFNVFATPIFAAFEGEPSSKNDVIYSLNDKTRDDEVRKWVLSQIVYNRRVRVLEEHLGIVDKKKK